MIRSIPAVVLFAIGAAAGTAAEQGQLDASPALFTVLAAANAAGYDADLGSPANSPVREMVRREITALNPPSLAELKRFFAAHRQKDWTAELSQYISFGLSIGDPPEFAWRYRTTELPPDTLALEDLRALLVRFHKEARLEELWQRAQPAFEAAIERYHQPATRAVAEVNAYLRSSASGPLGTRFQIYVDLVGAPNQSHTRSYKSDYFIVVTPSPEPQADEIRHAYMHYMLDSLAIRYAAELDKKRGLLDFAQAAPLLESQFKSDFLLLATECLIKAIEARLAPPAARQAMVETAFREGYIVTPAFFELLPAYERQEQSLRFFYPDLVRAIDLRKEEQRLERLEFATERPARKAKEIPAETRAPPAGAYRTLEEAERLYTQRELDAARARYLQALRETEERPAQATAYYGLARIAALQKDPETAEKLFQKTLEFSPAPPIRAWTYVYLGRLADAAGQRDQAVQHYRAALEVSGASEAARQAAQKGLEQAFRKQ
ncbi:MAG: tetratricopeptide repeat protein [Bryobacteraceae bacterium]